MAQIATDTFEFDLPETWRTESLQNPATIVGPGGELVMINSVLISGGQTDQGRQSVKDALQQNADDSMQNAASDAQLDITRPSQNPR